MLGMSIFLTISPVTDISHTAETLDAEAEALECLGGFSSSLNGLLNKAKGLGAYPKIV